MVNSNGKAMVVCQSPYTGPQVQTLQWFTTSSIDWKVYDKISF